MSILFVMIPLALVLLALAVWAFWWAARSGQFDDLDTPASRILFDDDDVSAQVHDAERADADPAR